MVLTTELLRRLGSSVVKALLCGLLYKMCVGSLNLTTPLGLSVLPVAAFALILGHSASGLFAPSLVTIGFWPLALIWSGACHPARNLFRRVATLEAPIPPYGKGL